MTIWIAKFLGPILLTLSLLALLSPSHLREVSLRFLADPPLILISGALAMLGGLAIVNTHNVWVVGWPLIITLFGWAFLLGGVFRILAPRSVDSIGAAMLDLPHLTQVMGVLWGLLGLFLTYKAYF